MREAALNAVSKRFRYSGFVNIVEEPEENLYPESQKNVLFSLLSLANRQQGNELLVTTHSPYMINFLTLAIKAGAIRRKGGDVMALEEVVPQGAWIDEEEVSIYQLERGGARLLDTYHGLPNDSNLLNNSFEWANMDFDRLLEIEEELDA